MSIDSAPVLEIRDLEFQYDEPLIHIDRFEVARQECVGLMGPSGCGKTTFIHLISGLLRPHMGSVRLNGVDLAALKESEVDRLRGQQMGIVFQRLHLIPAVSILDNLLLAQSLARKSVDRAFAIDLLEQLGLIKFLEKKPYELSQGQAQRVAIARSVAHKPSLVVADEPTSALDSGNAAEAMSLLKDLTRSAESALIIVTHDDRVRREVDRVFDLDSISDSGRVNPS